MQYITSMEEQDTGNMLKTVKQHRTGERGRGSVIEGATLT
jgi:hypothetical protein